MRVVQIKDGALKEREPSLKSPNETKKVRKVKNALNALLERQRLSSREDLVLGKT